jgi:CRP/FNR family transcriptional regulator, cyclic AMP receptor protein
VRRSLDELIAMHPFFAGLPPEAAELATGCSRNVVFAPGSLLLTEGEDARTFFLLRRGRVTVEVHAPGRGPVVIEMVGPGQVVGFSWLVRPYRWSFDARAYDPVGAIAVDGECLRAKAEADPAFGYALLSKVSEELLSRLQATRMRLLDLYGAPLAR